MHEPYTQSITLSWRTELRFFERRYAILRTLQDRGDMWAFHAEEQSVHARLFDDVNHQLTVRQNGAALHMLSPEPKAPRAWEVLKLAVESIEPRQAHMMAVTFQYVAPLAMDFDAAVRKAHGTILRIPGTRSVQPGDWAVLVDLNVAGPEGAEGQTEFGIVTAAEVPARLRREISRVTFADRPRLSGSQWADDEFAPVSLFADVTFRAPAVAGAGMLDALRAFWDALRVEAGSLVDELKDQFVPDDYEGRWKREQHGGS